MVKLVQGKVEQISIKPIANGPDRFDNTHRKSFKVDGVWYSMGGTRSEKWNVKIGNDFKVLGVGSTVAFKAEQSGDFWNGKSLMVLDLVEGSNSPAPQQNQGGTQQSSGYQAKPRDNTGQSTGHSLNGAMNFILTFGEDASNENIVALAKKVHNVTEKVKVKYKEMEPSLSDYDTGAASGQAVLTACKLVGTEQDFEDGVYGIAIDLLANVVPKVMAHVKGEVKQAPPAKVTKSPPAKRASTKATPVEPDEPDFEDDSEEIPF